MNSKSPSHPHVAWEPWLLFEKQLGFLMSQPYNEINSWLKDQRGFTDQSEKALMEKRKPTEMPEETNHDLFL